VALKVLPASLAADGERRVRLLREARSAAAVNHANIAAVFDVGETDGRVWLAMELVEGTTLRDRLAGGALPASETMRIARGIAAGLARAHEKGIVHRDLKPENVMLAPDGTVKILDFGLAKLREPDSTDSALQQQETQTLEGRVMGTPGYMSPEQASGRAVDARTDVYALGVVMHEMLTGGLPGVASGRRAIEDARLESIVARCVEAAPEQRWADAGRLLAALEVIGEPPARAPATRKRSLWLVAGALAVLVASGVLVARAGRPHAVSAGSASAASSVLPAATTLADLPLPASTVAEAVAEYKAGMQLLRDDSFETSRRHFARAGELDPSMAAAHLRSAIVGGETWDREQTRAEFAKAVALRAQLPAHERVLLEAFEPLVGRARPDPAETLRRLRAASEREPGDVELLDWLANRELNDPERAAAAARRAMALDPLDAAALEFLGRATEEKGDLEGARQFFERCVAVSLESTDCLGFLASLDSIEGRCEAMEADGRRQADVDPAWGYARVYRALLALGRPDAVVRDARDRSLVGHSPDETSVARAQLDAVLAARRGDLDGARSALDAEERAIQASASQHVNELANQQLLRTRVSLYRETGDVARARTAASDYLERAASLTEDANIGAAPRRPWWVWAVAGRPLDPARAAWVEEQLGQGVRVASVWLSAWAEPVQTPDDARAALDALSRDPRLAFAERATDGTRSLLSDSPTGHTYLLASRPADALPYLRHAVASCEVLADPFEYVGAQLDLGGALEQTGDAKGACDAYGAVLARWARATPRSVSAEAARAGMKRLGCGQ